MLQILQKIKNKYKNKILLSLALLFTFFFIKVLPNEIPYLDKKGDEYFSTAIKKSITIYGVTRLTNALVSVAKETEVEVSLGVGATIHIGQILDPLDDATERLSSVLVISLGTLTLLKLIKEVLTIYTFKIISYLLIPLIFLVWIEKLKNIVKFLTGLIILLLLMRLALPVSGVINSYIYQDYFKPKIDENLKVFRNLKDIYNKIGDREFSQLKEEKDKGIISKITDFFTDFIDEVKYKGKLIKTASAYLWDNREKLINAIVHLTLLEISLTIFQAILLPISIFWFLYSLANSILNPNRDTNN